MSCESIFRDFSDIHSRLFNHRAALQGLASNFVKEFEEKRGDKETTSLSRVLDTLCDTRDRSLPYLLDSVEDSLKGLKEAVNRTIHECDRISKDSEGKKTDWLDSQRQRRQEEWEHFMAVQVTRSSRVDNDYDMRVLALEKHYAELEEKVKGDGKAVL